MKTLTFLTIVLLFSSNLYSQLPPNIIYIPWDSIFFEHNTIPYQISPTLGNCWQVGHPSKTFFNDAYSLPLAIVTDTLEPYPINSNSSFTFSFANYLIYGVWFEFLQKFDSDTLTDYGSIDVSYDQGLTWEILKDSICQSGCMQLFWSADSVFSTGDTFPHVLKSSGHSNGWIRSRFTWWWGMPEIKNNSKHTPVSIYLKFTFHSDSIQTNKEGWMIDNIISGPLDVVSGIPDLLHPDELIIMPNPLVTFSKVICSKPCQNSIFQIFDLSGKRVFQKNVDSFKTFELRRQDFEPGIYFWTLYSENSSPLTGKFVVN